MNFKNNILLHVISILIYLLKYISASLCCSYRSTKASCIAVAASQHTLIPHCSIPAPYYYISVYPCLHLVTASASQGISCTSLVTPEAYWRISALFPMVSHYIPVIYYILIYCISANICYYFLGIIILYDVMAHIWRHGNVMIASPSYSCIVTGSHFCIGPYNNKLLKINKVNRPIKYLINIILPSFYFLFS